MLLYYFLIKILFFFGLVRSLIKFDPLKGHALFLATLYTAGVAFISYVFLLAPQPSIDWRSWRIWIGATFALSALYFWLLSRFDEGAILWALLIGGCFVVLF